MIKFITDSDIYKEVIVDRVPKANRFLWIGTSDLKDLYVDKSGKMVPFLEILSGLIQKNVSVRLIHAKEPGPNFRRDFDKYPNLFTGMERLLCPRIHFKSIIIDGTFAYTGSANLTGAGIGAKSSKKRNFEAGIITDQPDLIDKIAAQFDNIWMGSYCSECGRKEYCADFKDILKS
ncbi:MAG: hypothetical protein JW912_02685 [Sedimentisphaerales bacterium]|nr:hypothetical protein [Sedimentisphaerales bacterium]